MKLVGQGQIRDFTRAQRNVSPEVSPIGSLRIQRLEGNISKLTNTDIAPVSKEILRLAVSWIRFLHAQNVIETIGGRKIDRRRSQVVRERKSRKGKSDKNDIAVTMRINVSSWGFGRYPWRERFSSCRPTTRLL